MRRRRATSTRRPGAGHWTAEEGGTTQHRLRTRVSLTNRHRELLHWVGARRPGPPRPEADAGADPRRAQRAALTLAALSVHVAMLDGERAAFGPDYQESGLLFCWETGKPPHPDTITRRFKRLARSAGLPDIDLHDVRHSYATAGREAKIDWKALSARIGHADVAFTIKQHVQVDLAADRQVANVLAELIVGGSLASVYITEQNSSGNEGEAA
jgi:hypothetical protein